eukprot:NODE_557_length_6694_cov_0.358302.p2 type:complete len:299 gc:universal NODE_557_length_6694_cov_0.358302:1447-2343(+)
MALVTLLITSSFLGYVMTYNMLSSSNIHDFKFKRKYINQFKLENKAFYMSVKAYDQDDDFTRRTIKSVFSFRDYELFRVSDSECSFVLSSAYPKYLETFNELPFGVMKSDFCRYLMIYHFGGIYIDSDVVIRKSPEYWIPQRVDRQIQPKPIQVFIGIEAIIPTKYKEYLFYHPYQIAQWTFAANKQHDIFLFCLEDIHNRFHENKTYFNDINHIIELTGPGTMTRSVFKYIGDFIKDASVLQDAPIIIKDVYIGPPNTLNCGPNVYEGVVYECNKFTVSDHLYGGRWKDGLNDGDGI